MASGIELGLDLPGPGQSVEIAMDDEAIKKGTRKRQYASEEARSGTPPARRQAATNRIVP